MRKNVPFYTNLERFRGFEETRYRSALLELTKASAPFRPKRLGWRLGIFLLLAPLAFGAQAQSDRESAIQPQIFPTPGLEDAAEEIARGEPLVIRPDPSATPPSGRLLGFAPVPPRRPLPPGPGAGSAPEEVAPDASEPAPSPEQHAALPNPVQPQPSTTEEIETEEALTPEPNIAERQTEKVNIECVNPRILEFVQQAGAHFGATPIITSGQRDRGRRGSYHRSCMAVDFFVPGIERAVLAKYLRSLPGAGGVGTYCHTKAVHIDLGEARNWSQCGFRFRFALRR